MSKKQITTCSANTKVIAKSLLCFGLFAVLLFLPEMAFANSAVSLGEIGKNLGKNFKEFAPAVKYGAMLGGGGMAALGVKGFYDVQQQRSQSTMGAKVMQFGVGCLLLGLGAIIETGSTSIFGTSKATGVDELGL